MTDDNMDIPEFLRRNQQIKESPMTKQEAPKKTRQKTVLPSFIAYDNDGNIEVIINELTLVQLVEYQSKIKKKLEDAPRIALELKAINQAIRKLAK